MAIPTNHIDKITDHDSGESRPICPPAEHVSVDNENYEGETLDEVLDEVAQAIEEAGQGGYAPPQGGIPKTDLAQSVQDSLDKADSALQDEDVAEVAKTGSYNDLENKPTIPDTSGLATKTELQQGLGNKQDTLVAGNGITIAQDGKTVSVDAEVVQPVQADGSFAIRIGNNTYTINLNHTHPNMAKLIVCEESDLPSTYDDDTIYAITDSGETEIEKLIIKGMEFAGGGGTPSTEPKIVSPIGTQIDFNGASTKTVTVRASNLSEALTIAVTGVTANLQTISVNDAANGVQLTLTKGQNFTAGTLRIYSSEVDKSWDVIDSQAVQLLTAVKLTGSQWLQTDYKPNANTKITMRLKFTANANTIAGDSSNKNWYFLACPPDTSSTKWFMFYVWEGSAGVYTMLSVCPTTPPATLEVSGLLTDNSTFEAGLGTFSFTPNGGSKQLQNNTGQTETMNDALEIGHYHRNNDDIDTIFNWFDLTIYELTISENNVTKRHYVPRKINGVPGLYDTETGAFISSKTSTELVEIPLT